MFVRSVLILILILGTLTCRASAELKHCWIYIQTNLLIDENIDKLTRLIERASASGYNGVVIADSKFMRWDKLPNRYIENAQRFRSACKKLKLSFIPCVFPIGYSNDLLSRDANLVEGLPVKDAPFIVHDGRLIPYDESIAISNPSFEEYADNTPIGWGFVDKPGKISFIDNEVKFEGNASLRMQDINQNDPQHGNSRAYQKLKVRPLSYYHISVAIKTENFEAADQVRIVVLAEGGVNLNYLDLNVKKTQDWQRVDITFNSLQFSEVGLYLGIWGGKTGKIWWDDVKIEPAGLVNVIRRDGTPFVITSEDKNTIYIEGVDFDGAIDPKLGNVPWSGEYSAWHEGPLMTVPIGSKLKEGQKVLVSYYHPALIYWGAAMCCMSEPKVYEILRWQAEQVKKYLEPDGYFMSHDEIRVQGWDESCTKRNMTTGQILADNVKQCIEILHEIDPEKPIYVWSDMFDPFHNAEKTGHYYLVKGEGPWYGSWEGLDNNVVIVNWNGRKSHRLGSMKHFADRGHKQILAGYYDFDPSEISGWLKDASKFKGIIGVMYTTWRHNYSDLERFANEIGPFK